MLIRVTGKLTAIRIEVAVAAEVEAKEEVEAVVEENKAVEIRNGAEIITANICGKNVQATTRVLATTVVLVVEVEAEVEVDKMIVNHTTLSSSRMRICLLLQDSRIIYHLLRWHR